MTTYDTAPAAPAPGVADGPAAITAFYRPRSIVVVGAHDTRPGLAGVTQKAMEHAALVGGAFIPVNPRRESVYGVPCLPDLAAVEGPVDVVVVLVGDATGVVESATAAGLRVGYFLVFSNGFSELGTAEGREREARLLDAVRRSGARMVGPNTNANAWDPLRPLPGRRLAVVSQSGVQGRPLTQAQELGIALSYWAPTGNEADLEAADFIEFFVRDEPTAAVCAYIEGFKSGPRLRAAALSAVEAGTPIVLVKVGRTEAGGSMAQSHTGHLTGSDQVFDAFFEQFGVIRVDDFDQLVEIGAALARCPLPTADGVVVCSVSGGTAAHVADLATRHGIELPPLTPETQAALAELIPGGFRMDNPVDNGGTALLGGNGPEIGRLCLRDPHIGAMLAPVPASTPGLTAAVADMLVELAGTETKPILPIWSGPSVEDPAYRRLLDAGLPVFRNVRNALDALVALQGHPARNPALREYAALARASAPPPVARPGRLLDEDASTRWLAGRGVPFARHETARDADEAVAAAGRLGYPVVLKGLGSAHKSELGLVVLGLADAGAVRAAYGTLAGRGADGVVVAEQVSGGLELLAGVTTDPVLGPVVVIGAGGVTAEAAPDVARSVLPLTRDRAERMLASLRVAPLLDGWRGSPALARDKVVDLLLLLADLAATGEIHELDINPLTVLPGRVAGLDALVRLAHPEGDPS